MPFAEEAVISQLEDNLKGITSVTGLLDEGNHTGAAARETLGKSKFGAFRYPSGAFLLQL